MPAAIHDQCLKAADYSGCVKINSSRASHGGSSSEGVVDRFGLPKLDGPRFKGPDYIPGRDGGIDVYLDLASIRALKSNGDYGLYIAWNEIMRFYVPAIPGQPGYSIPIAGDKINCSGSAHGSVYGSQLSTYGSANCYTTPGIAMLVPGVNEVPGQPAEMIYKSVINCSDKTKRLNDKSPWKPWQSSMSYSELCGFLNRLPRGEEFN